MKRLPIALLFPFFLVSFSAVAEQNTMTPQAQGEVTFVSGGVGVGERQAMKDIKSNYNLSLLFSLNGSGDYLSDVKVRIKDANGNICLDTVADGPMLFAELKPGHYSFTADRNGNVITKQINIVGAKHTSLSLTWPQQDKSM